MDSENPPQQPWNEWLEEKYPVLTLIDKDSTMKKYDFPEHVRKGIADNWIKISDDQGGTWEKPKETDKPKRQDGGRKRRKKRRKSKRKTKRKTKRRRKSKKRRKTKRKTKRKRRRRKR